MKVKTTGPVNPVLKAAVNKVPRDTITSLRKSLERCRDMLEDHRRHNVIYQQRLKEVFDVAFSGNAFGRRRKALDKITTISF